MGAGSGAHENRLIPAWGICALMLCVLLAGGLPARAEPRLYSQETKHFGSSTTRPQHEYLAPLLIRSLENAAQFYQKKFGYEPKGKITILIQDFDDSGYGGAGTVPTNFIQIGIEPFNLVFETLPSAERMGLMSKHELMHIVMGDEAGPARRVVPEDFLRKDHAEYRRSDLNSLQFSRQPAGLLPALVPRGRGRVYGDLAGRGLWTRAGRLRRDGVPRDGARPTGISTTWWVSSRKERRQISRWARIHICTGRAL